MKEFVSLDDYEAAAREILPQMAYDYIAGGSDDEITLRDNRAAFERWRLRPRVLAGVGQRDLSVSILGQTWSFPVGLAPTAMHRLAHPDGELATARAAGSVGVMFCAATFATVSMEDIAQAASGPRWFQLYCYQDRGLTESLVDRAIASGYQAIVLTADAPTLGIRRRDQVNHFAPPPGISLKNFDAPTDHTLHRTPGSSLGAFISAKADDNLTWHDVDWLVGKSKLPVLVKGILTGEDARLAADHGAAGVIVSNHGGRQLDGSIAAIDALPEVVAALENTSVVVLADGGVRRGTDVLKLLALGANAVLIGRPVQWGLAVDGEAGVKAVLDLLRIELDIALALSGCKSAAAVTHDLLMRL